MGKITRPDGSPIGIDGVKYQLSITGIAGTGNNVAYTPTPKPDGTWSTKLAEGIYHKPHCKMTVPFAGDFFVYEAAPVADVPDTDSAEGIAGDFVWRISGPRPGYADHPDPANHTHWFGASCSVIWDVYYKDAKGKVQQHRVADGTRFVFRASPRVS